MARGHTKLCCRPTSLGFSIGTANLALVLFLTFTSTYIKNYHGQARLCMDNCGRSISCHIFLQESQTEQAPILEIQKRLGISISFSKAQVNLVDEMEDKELHELSSRLAGETLPTRDQDACIQVFF